MSHIQHLHVLSLYMYISLQLMFQQIAPFKNEKKKTQLALCHWSFCTVGDKPYTAHAGNKGRLGSCATPTRKFPEKKLLQPVVLSGPV